MTQKRKINPDFDNSYFLSLGADDKRFGRMYQGMLKHPRWLELKPMSKILLTTIIVHISTADNYKQLHNYCESQGIPEKYSGGSYFILSRAKLVEYGINPHRASEHFQELIESGFIQLIEGNKHRKMANIYRLCSKWKE